jgi:hypothetical protein
MAQEGLAERAKLGVRTVRRLEREGGPTPRWPPSGDWPPPELGAPLADATRQLALEVPKRWQREPPSSRTPTGGVRRAGAVYQFRHARLQDHLGATPSNR